MNAQTMKFWNDYWASQEEPQPKKVDAFQFGADADRLANLVSNGQKTATCSAYALYELEGESLPQKGQYSIVLDSRDMPAAIIQLLDVSIIPMNEVPMDFALAEGEGEYTQWWNAHEQFFEDELKKFGLSYSANMPLVCERFKVVCKA